MHLKLYCTRADLFYFFQKVNIWGILHVCAQCIYCMCFGDFVSTRESLTEPQTMSTRGKTELKRARWRSKATAGLATNTRNLECQGGRSDGSDN